MGGSVPSPRCRTRETEIETQSGLEFVHLVAVDGGEGRELVGKKRRARVSNLAV